MFCYELLKYIHFLKFFPLLFSLMVVWEVYTCCLHVRYQRISKPRRIRWLAWKLSNKSLNNRKSAFLFYRLPYLLWGHDYVNDGLKYHNFVLNYTSGLHYPWQCLYQSTNTSWWSCQALGLYNRNIQTWVNTK